MEMHHKLRRDPNWDPRGCNLCGQVGHQAVECPNGTVNWKQIYGEDAFVLRPPIYESQLREKRKLRTVDEADLRQKAEAFAKAAAAQQGLNWEDIARAAAASQHAQVQPAKEEPPDANLPEGWAMAKDPSGKPYYWHKATQKTQWDKPMA